MKQSHPLRTAKQRVVAETIWHAALELFGTQGYQGTTVEQIAEKAGLSRRTFFRYFPSKEAIVVWGMDAYGDLIVQAIRESARLRRPIEIVRAAVMRVAEFVVAQPTARLGMRISDENPEVRAAQVSRLHRVESKVGAELCRALNLRNPHHPQVTTLAGTTVMLIDMTLRTWYRDGGAPLERTVDALIESIRLLGVERAPAPRRAQHSPRRSVRASRSSAAHRDR